MKYNINYGNRVISLPGASIDKLSAAGETELKVLLAVCSGAEDISACTGCSNADIESALAFWRGAGILEGEKKTERKVKRHASDIHYSGEELGRILDENGLGDIINACGNIIGKPITNQTEVSRIAALNSYLGLDGEFILLLFTFCAEIGKTSLKYIEKTGYDLYDMGIDTVEKLEEHIRRREEFHQLENKLRTMFGMGDRALTPTEKKHFTQWYEEYGYGIDIITEAYDITVEKTGKLSIPYLSKILSNWHSKNLHTLEDIKTSLAEYEKAKTEKQEGNSSFDVDEFFELALKRSRDKILND